MMSECLVETVRSGKHVGPGELGEIVVTTFINRAMPLIRYRPGDVGRLYEDYCSCGRQTPLLTLEGRMEDTIVTSRGIRTEKEIIDFLMRWPNIEFAQLVQRSETRCDLLVVEKESGKTNLYDLSDATNKFLGDEIEVRPRLVSTIKPEVSGKFRFVKSTSFEHFHEGTPIQALHKPKGALQTDQTISAR
jgi:phenylacetate-CoA ligase